MFPSQIVPGVNVTVGTSGAEQTAPQTTAGVA